MFYVKLSKLDEVWNMHASKYDRNELPNFCVVIMNRMQGVKKSSE